MAPQSTDILFPGYGVQLEALAIAHKQPDLADPLSILNDSGLRAASHLAQLALENGATTATLNTFWARKLIGESGQEGLKTFQAVIRQNLAAVLFAEENSGLKAHHIVAQFGPGAQNCYDPATALNFNEARDFHGEQARLVREVDTTITPWFETFPTIAEARGAAAGLKGDRAIISFVLNKDGDLRSGESLKDAVRAVLEINPKIRFGANCFPIEAAEKALKSLGELVKHFAVIYPNASSLDPSAFDGRGGKIIHSLPDRDHTSRYLNYLAKKFGLEIIGGCCGYNCEDIGALSKAVRQNIFTSILPPTDKKPFCDCHLQAGHSTSDQKISYF